MRNKELISKFPSNTRRFYYHTIPWKNKTTKKKPTFVEQWRNFLTLEIEAILTP